MMNKSGYGENIQAETNILFSSNYQVTEYWFAEPFDIDPWKSSHFPIGCLHILNMQSHTFCLRDLSGSGLPEQRP